MFMVLWEPRGEHVMGIGSKWELAENFWRSIVCMLDNEERLVWLIEEIRILTIANTEGAFAWHLLLHLLLSFNLHTNWKDCFYFTYKIKILQEAKWQTQCSKPNLFLLNLHFNKAHIQKWKEKDLDNDAKLLFFTFAGYKVEKWYVRK